MLKNVQRLRELRGSYRKTTTPGARVLGSLLPSRGGIGWPGGWSSDRLEQVMHFRNWNYVTIHTICSKIAQTFPNIAYVRHHKIPGVTTKHGESIRDFGGTTHAAVSGTLTPTVGFMYRKSLSSVKAHEELEPVEYNHPLRRLLENPNPMDTCYDLMYELQLFIELCGVSYLWVVPNTYGVPCELWVLPAHWVWPVTGKGEAFWTPQTPDTDNLIAGYQIRPWNGMGVSGIMTIPAEDMIVFSNKNPLNKLDGWSPQAAGAMWIDTEESIVKSRWAQMCNQARSDVHIELPADVIDPDDNRIARIEAKFMAKYQGELNYGKPIFTPGGTKVTPLSFSPQEMAYFQSEEQMRDMVMALRQFPKTAAGISNDMTFGSVLATAASFCSNSINPRLAPLGQRLTKELAPRFATEADPVKLWWDDCSPADPQQVNSDISQDLQAYAITPNEVRALRGRPPYKHGGDDPLVSGPGGMIPLPLNTGEDQGELSDLVPVYPKDDPGEGNAPDFGDDGGDDDGGGDYGGMPDLTTPSIAAPNGNPSKGYRKSWGKLHDAIHALEDPSSVKVYYNESENRVYVNVMDWGQGEEADRIVTAAEKLVGTDNVEAADEGSKPLKEEGWDEVKCGGKGDNPSRYSPSKGYRMTHAEWIENIGVSKAAKSREFSSTQFDLNRFPKVSNVLRKLQERIDPADLTGDGLETDLHVTVKYGLKTEDIQQVRSLVEGFGPVRIKLGKVSLFQSEEQDVVKVEVGGPDIHRLNSLLARLPHKDTYPVYSPHVTLGYVLPGEGEKYVGEGTGAWATLTLDSLTFSDKEGYKTTIPLANGVKAVTKVPSISFRKESAGKTTWEEKGVIGDTVQSAGRWLANKWENLEARYGRKAALAMAVASIATFPIPGNITAVIGVAEAIRGISGWFQRDFPAGEEKDKILRGWDSMEDGGVTEPDEIEAGEVVDKCGGEGGTPGPCPDEGGGESKPSKPVGKRPIKGPHVDAAKEVLEKVRAGGVSLDELDAYTATLRKLPESKLRAVAEAVGVPSGVSAGDLRSEIGDKLNHIRGAANRAARGKPSTTESSEKPVTDKPAQPKPASPEKVRADASTLLSGFDKLDTGRNWVSLLDLRRQHPDIPKEEFDQAINHLRREGVLTAGALEGREGATREELDAAIRGSDKEVFGYLSRRNPKKGKTTRKSPARRKGTGKR